MANITFDEDHTLSTRESAEHSFELKKWIRPFVYSLGISISVITITIVTLGVLVSSMNG